MFLAASSAIVCGDSGLSALADGAMFSVTHPASATAAATAADANKARAQGERDFNLKISHMVDSPTPTIGIVRLKMPLSQGKIMASRPLDDLHGERTENRRQSVR